MILPQFTFLSERLTGCKEAVEGKIHLSQGDTLQVARTMRRSSHEEKAALLESSSQEDLDNSEGHESEVNEVDDEDQGPPVRSSTSKQRVNTFRLVPLHW